MNIIWALSFVVLLGSLCAQYLISQGKTRRKTFICIFSGVILCAVLYYVYLTYAQYVTWRDGSDFSKFLVPPYNSPWYVIQYHFIRVLLYYLIALGAAAALIALATFANKKYGEQFLEAEEPFLLGISMVILGGPDWKYGWIAYLLSLFIVYFVIQLITVIKTKDHTVRVPLYHLWLPVAILVIIGVRFF